jgi:hypothetical protein
MHRQLNNETSVEAEEPEAVLGRVEQPMPVAPAR